ncbi:MAG: ion channel protein [Leifsonia sp.]
MSVTDEERPPAIRTLVLLSIPALAIGIVSALVLRLLDLAADGIEDVLWTAIPAAVGIPSDSPWWIMIVLTATGVAVGAGLWLIPGHGGPDSATTELVEPPLQLRILPSLAIVTVLSLAGGVSLGPENPIIAINCALAVAAVSRFAKAVPAQLAVLLAASGTIGALFGTPVAAALVFTGIMAAVKMGGSLWDKLFAPLVAAGAGAITMRLVGGQTIEFSVPAYGSPQAIDLLTGTIVAAVGAVLMIVAAAVFPVLHRAFHALRHPMLYVGLGGLVLGVLGAIGGPITLFKGLEQTGELITDADDYTAGQFALFTGVKIVALLIAASAGFRGGRIFPAVFVGTAFGLFAYSVIPGMPEGLAIACGVLGVVLVAARDGWIAIFLGIALTSDITLLPMLCVIILPVWLLVSHAPHLVIPKPPAPTATTPGREEQP